MEYCNISSNFESDFCFYLYLIIIIPVKFQVQSFILRSIVVLLFQSLIRLLIRFSEFKQLIYFDNQLLVLWKVKIVHSNQFYNTYIRRKFLLAKAVSIYLF